ncbi:MAG TPA: hypothetical protein VF756_18960 [Thermoanaerobaculia bacterium]
MANGNEEDDERSPLDDTLGMRVELRPGKHLGEVEESFSVEEADYPRFRRLTFFSVLGGLCPLIPVPFLDEWARDRVHRRMVLELGESRDLGLTENEARILAGIGERRPWPGVFKGGALLVRKSARKIVRKLSKAAFYVLLLREGVEQAVETFLQGYLILYAARRAQGLRPAGRTEDRVRAVRAAIMATVEEADVRPVRQAITRAFQGSFDLLARAATLLGNQLSRLRSGGPAEKPNERLALEEEEDLLGGIVDRLSATLWGNQEYFERLEKSFEQKLSR